MYIVFYKRKTKDTFKCYYSGYVRTRVSRWEIRRYSKSICHMHTRIRICQSWATKCQKKNKTLCKTAVGVTVITQYIRKEKKTINKKQTNIHLHSFIHAYIYLYIFTSIYINVYIYIYIYFPYIPISFLIHKFILCKSNEATCVYM